MNDISHISPHPPSTWENFQKYAHLIARQCYRYCDCAHRRRIHPDSSDENSGFKQVFFKFQSNKYLRVIHLAEKKSNFINSHVHRSNQSTDNERTFSFSESDYAFMCWSKPLRLCDECRRSFKNLWHETSNSSVNSPHNDDLKDNTNVITAYSTSKVQSKPLECPSYLQKFVKEFVENLLNDAILTTIHSGKNIQSSSSHYSKYNLLSSAKLNDRFENEIVDVAIGDENIEKDKHSEQRHGCVVESDSCQEQEICVVSKTNAIFTTSNHLNEQQLKRDEETFAYYNSSYSDADEEPNVVQLKLQERNGVSQNKKISICSHLKNKTLKPILLFLHGVGCSADLWTHLLQYFENEGYEVVAPDMLGHGYSSTPDCPTVYRFYNLLKNSLDIFDTLVGEMKCVVIGHAFGCSLAAAIARYRPQQVSQLVLISGGGPTPLAPRRADFRPPAVSPWLQMCLKPLLWCGLKREILYVPCGKHIETADFITSGVPSYVLNHIARGQDWPEGDSAFHRRILVPTLLVHGMKDPYVTLVQECEMERTIPRSSLELITNAGHFAMLETPDKLCHMIQCFINWWNQ